MYLYNFYLFIYLFIFGCVGSSLVCGLFSSFSELGLLFIPIHRLLIAMASHYRIQALGRSGFSSCVVWAC